MASESIEDKDILERALLFVIELLGRNKLKLLIAILVGGILGVGFSFTKPRKYKSAAALLPEMSSGSLGSLNSLASLAGIETSSPSESDAIRPDVYPAIMKSSSALIYLLNQPVKSDSGKAYPTLLSYFEEKHKVKIDPMFLKLNTEDSIYKYKKQELNVIGALKSAIDAEVDKKVGIITASVEMEDARIAAIVLSNSIAYLKKYVTEYRYGKKHTEKDFVDSQLATAKNRMIKARSALQSFRDRNRNIFMNTAKIEEDRLNEEYNFAQGVYASLQRQSETLTISEQATKPLFEIVEPPMVPVSKSSPNRLFYGIGGGFLAFFLTTFVLIILNNRRSAKA